MYLAREHKHSENATGNNHDGSMLQVPGFRPSPTDHHVPYINVLGRDRSTRSNPPESSMDHQHRDSGPRTLSRRRHAAQSSAALVRPRPTGFCGLFTIQCACPAKTPPRFSRGRLLNLAGDTASSRPGGIN